MLHTNYHNIVCVSVYVFLSMCAPVSVCMCLTDSPMSLWCHRCHYVMLPMSQWGHIIDVTVICHHQYHCHVISSMLLWCHVTNDTEFLMSCHWGQINVMSCHYIANVTVMSYQWHHCDVMSPMSLWCHATDVTVMSCHQWHCGINHISDVTDVMSSMSLWCHVTNDTDVISMTSLWYNFTDVTVMSYHWFTNDTVM